MALNKNSIIKNVTLSILYLGAVLGSLFIVNLIFEFASSSISMFEEIFGLVVFYMISLPLTIIGFIFIIDSKNISNYMVCAKEFIKEKYGVSSIRYKLCKFNYSLRFGSNPRLNVVVYGSIFSLIGLVMSVGTSIVAYFHFIQ